MSPPREPPPTDGDGDALVAFAARQRKQAARQPRAGDDEPRMPDALLDDDDDGGNRAAPDAKPRARPRRMQLTDDGIAADAPSGEARPAKPPRAKEAEKPRPKPRKEPDAKVAGAAGLVTKGVQAGLRSVDAAQAVGARLGAWGIAALAAAGLALALGVAGAGARPAPAAVSGLRVSWLDGPRVADRDVLALVRSFPGLHRLERPDRAALADLQGWLADQPLVREVRQVRLVHEPDGARRTVEIRLGLRAPAMPVVLASGARAWVDTEARVLPGILPPPPGPPRPILRAIEGGGRERILEALWLWERLERQLEPGLVVGIHLDEALDLQDQRGIVLHTRQGSRLVWGRPDDGRFGIDREDKVRDLVHTIRCQGDLARIAVINVRFKEPFFTMR